jgi:biotin carboxylase
VRVVVLHARQPILVDLLETFPPDRFDVSVLTDAEPAEVFRRGTPNVAPIVRAPRAEWHERIAAGGGAVEIVTNDEYCTVECARLRERAGLARRHPAALAAYRDKVAMKSVLARAGVDVPRHVALDAAPAVSADALVAELGLPLVVKPREESNNRGVEVIADRARLDAWLAERDGLGGWEAEEFVAGRALHANALVVDGAVTPMLVGEYTSSLLGLGWGRPVGSVTVAGPLAAVGHELNERVVAALGADGRFVVHTEFVLTEDGRAVVLETAARAPGALVSEMAALHVGVQLEKAHLRVQAGEPAPAPRATGQHAAWMWFPFPPQGPERLHRPALRSDYRLQLLPEGTFLAAGLLLWNADPEALRADLADLEREPVVSPPRPPAPHTTS